MKASRVLIAAALLGVASPVVADDSGFYFGIGAGQATTEVDDILGSGFEFDEDDTGFKVFGGYQFLPWLGVELAYIDAGNPKISESEPLPGGGQVSGSLEVETTSLVAAVKFSLPLGDRFELFLKPGFAYWSSDTALSYSEPGFSYGFSDDDSGSAFFLGGGVGFAFTERFGARIEYEWFEVAPEYDSDEGEFVDELDASAYFLSASVVFKF